ncbi:MAG: hypothetical protein AMQ22_01349 [Candidatus Methanofastidiosum methylothiophilum]|uniref:Uncharacterized protein n=1 Tax=Candidatus Methanofastidiosum methylothiophilum TaxID=1705564 RepID=A0A150J1V1_9EURY|nr:MAG: hypothetical protein AMQ22_01349 [Candidatus Methanofastidiosum methylthiophilus]
MALVGDDEVEGLDRQLRVVADLFGARVAGGGVELRLLLERRVELQLAAQHREEPLDGGDADPADRVEGVGGKMLDVVEVGEPAAVVGRDVLLELAPGLAAEIVAVHEEQDAPGAGMLDEPIAERDRGESLAAARGHLNQRARPGLRERRFEIGDGFDLAAAQAGGHQRRQPGQAAAQGVGLREPLAQNLGPVEREDAARARVGVALVPEERLGAGALVGEPEPVLVKRQGVGNAALVLAGLVRHAGQGRALGLGFDDPAGLAVHEYDVVRRAGFQRELPHDHAGSGAEVDEQPVLHYPAGGFEQLIYSLTSPLFRGHRPRV